MRPIAPLGALALAVMLAAAGLHVASGSGSEPRPLPFDPLTEGEQARAIEIALASPLVAFLLHDYETIGAAVHTDKRYGLDNMPRLADVWFYDYTTDQVVWPVVDLDRGVVASLTPIATPFQPPLTGGEQARAESIALASPLVAKRLGEGVIASASHLWTGAGTPCPVHRCVIVGFMVDDVQDYSFFPLVDLSTGTLVDVIENDWFVSSEVQE